MKNKETFASQLSDSAKNKKLYNPNTFNAIDSAVIYIIALIITEVVSIVFSLIIRLKVVNMENADTYFLMFVGLILAQGVICLTAFLFGKKKNIALANGGGFRCQFKPLQFAMGMMVIAGLMFTFTYVADTYVGEWQSIWSRFGMSPSNDEYHGNILFGVLAVLMTPLLPAIFEEWLYRGIIMKGLRELGDLAAVILSSLMFALMHGSMDQFIFQFFVGFAIGGAVMITKNYLLGCVMHFFNNVLAQITAVIFASVSSSYLQIYTICSIVIGALCLMIGLGYFVKFVAHNVRNAGKYASEFEPQYIVTDTSSYEFAFDLESWDKPLPLNERNAKTRTLFMYGDKGLRPANSKSNVPLAATLVGVGVAIALSLVLLNDFGYLGKLVSVLVNLIK